MVISKLVMTLAICEANVLVWDSWHVSIAFLDEDQLELFYAKEPSLKPACSFKNHTSVVTARWMLLLMGKFLLCSTLGPTFDVCSPLPHSC